MGLDCQRHPLDALASDRPLQLPHAKDGMLLIVTCTYNRMPPKNAKELNIWLGDSEAAKQLKGVNFSAFVIDISQWQATYQKFPR